MLGGNMSVSRKILLLAVALFLLWGRAVTARAGDGSISDGSIHAHGMLAHCAAVTVPLEFKPLQGAKNESTRTLALSGCPHLTEAFLGCQSALAHHFFEVVHHSRGLWLLHCALLR